MAKPDTFLKIIGQTCLLLAAACVFAGLFFLVNGVDFPLVPQTEKVVTSADSVLALSGRQIHPVSYRQLKRLMERDDAVLIDVRGTYDYALGHIPGAVNIPLTDLEKNYDVIEDLQTRFRVAVTYCDSPDCMESLSMAYSLQLFFPEIYYYVGGWHDYRKR